MLIYAINIILIGYWYSLYYILSRLKKPIAHGIAHISDNESIAKKFILLMPFIQIYLLLSLKGNTVGTDTVTYLYGFNTINTASWDEIMNVGIGIDFERGFIYLSKCITMMTSDFSLYTAIIYGILIIPVYKIIKNYSPMPFLSLFLFIVLGFLNFYASGIRQAIAISLILLAYEHIIKRKFWRFFILVAIATQFHQSSLFFFPAYFLMNITLTPIMLCLYFTSLVVAFAFRFQIVGYVIQYVYSNVSVQSTGAYTLLIIVFMTFVVGLVSYKKVIQINSKNKLLYNLIAVSLALMIVNTVTEYGLRVAYYYYIFMILFIPTIITSYPSKLLKRLALVIVILFTLVYYFEIGVHALNGTPYTWK